MPDSVSIATLDKVILVAPLMNGEKLYPPASLAKASNIPGHRGGSHLNGCTLFRHITKGVLAANGERVYLEAVRVGHRWLSSLEALARFAEKLTAAQFAPTETTPPPESPRQHNRAAKAATAELDARLGTRRDSEGA